MKKCIFIVCYAMFPGCLIAQEINVSSLIEKISEAQNKYDNCYLKCESSTEVTSKGRTKQYQTISELFYDGDRSNLRGYRWGEMDSSGNLRSRGKADYVRTMYNGEGLRHYTASSDKNYYYYTIDPTISKERSQLSVKRSISRGWNGHEALGYFGDDERVDVHLQEADAIQLKDTKEKVNGVDCYFLEAISKNVKYKLWIDPAHNYNITKAIVLKMPNSFMGSKRLVDGEVIRIEVNVISYKKVDGVWVVSEADIVRQARTNEYKFLDKSHYKILDVQFNPDFDKLEAFSESDVKNGTRVWLVGVDGINYTWQDGELIPNVDEAVISELDKMADEIMAERTASDANDIFAVEAESKSVSTVMTVSELLAKYAETQDKLRYSFISKSETIGKFEGFEHIRPALKKDVQYKVYKKNEIRSDGNRHYAFNKSWGDRLGKHTTTEEHANNAYALWDMNKRYQYTYHPDTRTKSRENGILFLTPKDKITIPQNRMWTGGDGGPLRGFFYGENERIDSEIREAKTISLQPEREEINGSKCYVINAKTKGCEYKIWIDPEHDYNIAKAIVKRGWWSAGRPEKYSRRPTDGNSRTVLKNVHFKKIGDVWLPAECDYTLNTNTVHGDYLRSHKHHKITEFMVNPDHDALRSFEPDFIKNGAMVRIKGISGIKYTWQDGELIPDVDESVIDQLDKMAEEIMAERTDSDANDISAVETESKSVLTVMTISELLAKYKASQDKLQSFIAKGKSTIEHTNTTGQSSRVEKVTCEFRTDGDRVSHRAHFQDNITPYKSFLWDGKNFIQYRQAGQLKNSMVFIKKHDRSKKEMIATEYKGAALMGICSGDFDRIDFVLRKADNISLRDETEKVGESECYVIDAETKRGKYTVWFDPQHDYNIGKIEVQRKKGDLVREMERIRAGMSFFLENVRFEKIDDVWVPMEADMRQTEDNQTKITKWHHKRTEMVLNPDHDASGSFVADDIPDGTKVSIAGSYDKYTWQNGGPAAAGDNSNVRP